MKIKTLALRDYSLLLALALSLQPSALLWAAPLGTAFSYQGQLQDNAQPASGFYDLRFTVFDAPTNGSMVSDVLTKAATPVSNGLFTVTLDFGSDVFTGEARWLEIGVHSNSSPADFTLLSPRQPLTPSPYALYAPKAGDAALLNGQAPAAFAPAAGSAAYVAKSGDTMSGSLDVGGNLGYSGLLSVLDVAENNTATVRAHDLNFGHSSRRGAPGRALGDLGDALALNYDRDWPYLTLYGNVVVDPSTMNTGSLSSGLVFGSWTSGEGMASERDAGVNQFGLDFYTSYQPRRSILNRGDVGIGTTNPTAKLEVAGTIKAESVLANGQPVLSGLVQASNLAPGTAAANLAASGQSAVPGGGMILSSSANEISLLNAGYIKLGRLDSAMGGGWEEGSGEPVSGRFVSPKPVWTGSEMIVWQDGQYSTIAGRFNPAANSWTALTAIGAPASRAPLDTRKPRKRCSRSPLPFG